MAAWQASWGAFAAGSGTTVAQGGKHQATYIGESVNRGAEGSSVIRLWLVRFY